MRPGGLKESRIRVIIRSAWLRVALGLLFAQAVALCAVIALGRGTYRVGAMDVEISLGIAHRGCTTLRIPPLGRVRARTHRAPVEVKVLAEKVYLRSTRDLLAKLKNQRITFAQMERDAYRAAQSFLGRLILIAFLSGAGGALLIGLRRWKQWTAAGLCAVAVVGTFTFVTLRGYNPRGFRNPEYTGVLSEAPNAIALVRRGVANIDRLQNQLRWAATNLAEFYARLEGENHKNSSDNLRILHVSDVHNNPAALDFIAGLTQAYDVRLILCTGDMTDYGTSLENLLLRKWKRIGVPTFFIGGNHDSRATLNLLAGLPNMRVLADGQAVTFEGLTLIGWNDPISRREGLGSVNHTDEEVARQESAIREWLQKQEQPPPLLMVHHYKVAESLAGLTPTILYGHDHRPRIEQRDGTVLVDAGTTGAAGIRYFTVEEPPPYSAALLHFSADSAPTLQAVDLISVHEPSGDFTVTRTTVNGHGESSESRAP